MIHRDSNNIFNMARDKMAGNPAVIAFYLLSWGILLVGLDHFVEDYLSSYYGLKNLESSFGIRPATYPITYFTMSITPQIAQGVFAYVWLLSPIRNWKWGLGAALWLLLDFMVDVWYRSGGNVINSLDNAMVSISLTLVFFTIGSEIFLSMGVGLIAALSRPFFDQIATMRRPSALDSLGVASRLERLMSNGTYRNRGTRRTSRRIPTAGANSISSRRSPSRTTLSSYGRVPNVGGNRTPQYPSVPVYEQDYYEQSYHGEE